MFPPSPNHSRGYCESALPGTHLSLAGAAASIVFVATKHIFCHDKSMLAATKVFVVTKLCLSRQKFCCNKQTFDKHVFVMTRLIHLAPDQPLLRNPLRREVTVSNDPSIQLWKSVINTRQQFQLTLYLSQFANTLFLYIQQVLIIFFFFTKK